MLFPSPQRVAALALGYDITSLSAINKWLPTEAVFGVPYLRTWHCVYARLIYNIMPIGIHPQRVAALALGYGIISLAAINICVVSLIPSVSLRLHWANISYRLQR